MVDTTLPIAANPQHTNARVAMDSNGDFVVAWELDTTGAKSNIYYRRYNADGTAKTPTTWRSAQPPLRAAGPSRTCP